MLTVAQVIKVGNGFSHSYVKDKLGNTCSHKGYSIDLGIDYLEYNYFYVSSAVGYTPIGIYGYDYDYLGNANRSKYLYDNIYLATTLKCKMPVFYKCFMFAGIGPRIDYSNRHNTSYVESLINAENRKYSFGINGEFGIFYDIDKFRISVDCSYSKNFKDLPKVKIRTYHISIGYIL
jgi:hypothetical protein